MKMFNKSDCEYKSGYIVSGDKIVAIDNEVVDLFNKLEDDLQRKEFERNSCGELPCYKEPGEFARVTEHGNVYPHVTAKTPELDKVAEQAIAIMDEIDQMKAADEVNDYFDGIKPILMFTSSEFVVSGEQATQHRFDLPTVGNPLKLTTEDLAKLVVGMFE